MMQLLLEVKDVAAAHTLMLLMVITLTFSK
jgi:hypothetical protein